MITTNLFDSLDTHRIINQKGCFSVLEYIRDVSVKPDHAFTAYYASEMNVRKKQLIASLNDKNGVIAQAGAMQIMMGDIGVSTNIKSPGDFFKKIVGSRVTDETAVKPYYQGEGILVLEPTYKHILLLDVEEWNGSLIIEDGMFLACEDTLTLEVKARTNLSSALLGNEGLFNTSITGSGVVAVESPVPYDEIIVVDIKDDVVKLDGSFAIAWSQELDFTVERTTKTLLGSFASGEGFVNVYQGTGRLWIAPVFDNRNITVPEIPGR